MPIFVKASRRAKAYWRSNSQIVRYTHHTAMASKNFSRFSRAETPLRAQRAKALVKAHSHHARMYMRDIEDKYRAGRRGKLFSNTALFRKLKYS